MCQKILQKKDSLIKKKGFFNINEYLIARINIK